MRITREQVEALYVQPLMDLLHQAQQVHRAHHDPNLVQASTLLSIKTGACPEDCGYCSQSAHHKTEVKLESLVDVQAVVGQAREAKAAGSSRFCMSAAWRRLPDNDLPRLQEMVRQVKALGLETCMTLGTLRDDQAQALSEAGLDYYNHNLDTSREYYPKVVGTRDYDERLNTLQTAARAGMKLCTGGILGLGETRADRVWLLWELANLPVPPSSVPVNTLVPVEGTRIAAERPDPIDPIELVRTVACARILLPEAQVRLSAGRDGMDDALQALCFLAGANSVFSGERLLTTDNAPPSRDASLFARLGMRTS